MRRKKYHARMDSRSGPQDQIDPLSRRICRIGDRPSANQVSYNYELYPSAGDPGIGGRYSPLREKMLHGDTDYLGELRL